MGWDGMKWDGMGRAGLGWDGRVIHLSVSSDLVLKSAARSQSTNAASRRALIACSRRRSAVRRLESRLSCSFS